MDNHLDETDRVIYWRKNLRKSVLALLIAGISVFAVVVSSNLIKTNTENRIQASNPPVIVTKSLEMGKTGQKYTNTLLGYDLDLEDTLSFKAAGLPEGLTIQKCLVEKLSDRVQLSCSLAGIPLRSGNYEVQLSLIDAGANETIEKLMLYIEH